MERSSSFSTQNDGRSSGEDEGKQGEVETESNDKENAEEKTDMEPSDQKGEGEGQDSFPPPEIQYTLHTVSEDVDNFLATFSVPEQEEKKGKDNETQNENENETETENDNEIETEGVVAKVDIPDFVDKFLDLVQEKIVQYSDNKVKWSQVPEEDDAFLEAVDLLSRLYKSLSEGLKSDSNYGALINRIGGIQQRVMCYLEDEFRSLLEDTMPQEVEQKKDDEKAKGEAESSEPTEDSKFPGYSPEVLSNLSKIAKRFIFGGYESECCQVYMVTRRHAFDESLRELGYEKISTDDVLKMQWETLERELPTWIKAFKYCAAIYYRSERKMADAIFADYSSTSSSLFVNLTRGSFIQFLNFAEAVAMTKRSSEKLFKLLDMYEALRDGLPGIEELFPEELAKDLRAEAATTRCRLGEATICIFCDLENSIKAETGRTPVPGGAVHPLTRYIMNYLKLTCDYKVTLEQVFKEHSRIERTDSTSRPRHDGEDYSNHKNDRENESPFSEQLMRVMDLLDANLEAKSKLYRDNSLSCIFMMNNGRYMLQKIKGSTEIHELVGDTWCRKRSSYLRNYHKNYQRETWTKLLGSLSIEGLMANGKVVKPVLKEKFKSFNAMFEEIHRTQSSWVVYDEQLQSELRVSISAVVIPAYRSFLGRFSQYLDPGRQTEKYIKFQPDDIETYIDELFDGNPSMGRRRP